MTDPTGPPAPKKATERKTAIAAAIAVACALAVPLTAQFEGKKNVAYSDRLPTIPVPTACFGHTGPEVKVGQRYSDAQCSALLQGDLKKHAEGVAACTPGIIDRPQVFAGVTDFTFNLGVRTYCQSTAAKLFAAGKWRDGCNRLALYNRAGGRVVTGLVRRRAADVALCLKGA
jgi:lysozyme